MFGKHKKRFFVVVNSQGGMSDGTHHESIASARERAEALAIENQGEEFLVCMVDSSYNAYGVCATHYS